MTTRASTIVYPEADGMPLPDGEFQSPLFRRIVGDLDDHHRDVPGAKVNGNTFIYFVEGNPRRSISPDCYVALGLSEEALESIERNNVDLRVDEDSGRVPSEPVPGVGEDRTVWGVGCDRVQPSEDVEADSRDGGRGACLRLVCRGRGAPFRPRSGL